MSAENAQESMSAAGALYSQSVDLANEGKYQEALDAADKALAKNDASMTGLIQSNRAGILVMLQRYDEAIAAADAAIGIEGNLTTVHSIAWYNKGNAFRALGRIPEAQEAYDHAYALDRTLVPPDMSLDVTIPATAATPLPRTQKSPLSPLIAAGAFGLFSCAAAVIRQR
ncbi:MULTISPECIES: tetratricopeptide repeat protein [unclassified Methanoregula]|uniref:tetratricopeptide repeat protein n=1 Tax=unclassified Methanoregula TaxID=2649730 RepID=UPI0025CFDE0D|nr:MULTISPECIES: tetratricopeptide repeat protein [unclassified Methanoregula]